MADSGVRRNDLEILKGCLSPAQEHVALHVALKLKFRVQAERIHVAKIIHLHGMINDQLSGEQRVDSLRAAPHALHRFSHGGEVDDRRHASKVLQQDARGHKSNLFFRSPGSPARQRPNVLGMDKPAILAANQILQKYAQ